VETEERSSLMLEAATFTPVDREIWMCDRSALVSAAVPPVPSLAKTLEKAMADARDRLAAAEKALAEFEAGRTAD
jgi:hypothetical protein